MFGRIAHVPWDQSDNLRLTICSGTTRLGERTVRFDDKLQVLLTRQDVRFSAHLLWNGQFLNPNQTFKDYGIADGDVIVKVQTEFWDKTEQPRRWEQLSKEEQLSPEVRSLISARAMRRQGASDLRPATMTS